LPDSGSSSHDQTHCTAGVCSNLPPQRPGRRDRGRYNGRVYIQGRLRAGNLRSLGFYRSLDKGATFAPLAEQATEEGWLGNATGNGIVLSDGTFVAMSKELNIRNALDRKGTLAAGRPMGRLILLRSNDGRATLEEPDVVGDTGGFAATADGVFHAFRVDDRTGTGQVWTAAITVNGNAYPNGAAELATLQDVSASVTLDVSRTQYDPATKTITLTAALLNTSESPLTGPFTLRLLEVRSIAGLPEIVNADGDRATERAAPPPSPRHINDFVA
jgi:hypothetical protein